MKVWKIDYHQEDSASGWVYEWFGTKAEATARHKELSDDLEGNKVTNLSEPEPFEIPKAKAALLRFLNSYASNGISA